MSYSLASHDLSSEGRSEPPVSPALAFQGVVGESPALLAALDFAKKVAQRSLANILLVGETGTGKELFARGIHYSGPDPGEPFVAVNCSAIPQALLESELFGHERGAFTDARSQKRGLMELAGHGTLFLDEITDLPADLQPKLLRALEERRVRRLGGFNEVDVRCRMVAATNRSLELAVSEGKFREDLFYRLNVLRVALPPLRDRGGDLDLLIDHFLAQAAHEQGMHLKHLSRGALDAMRRHAWPGNVRELRNVIERAALLSSGQQIEPTDLRISSRGAPVEVQAAPVPDRTIRIPIGGMSLADVEAAALRHTLSITGGNQSAAARILGVSRPTLKRKLERYRIDPGSPGSAT
jgi:transcriptional regulator with PAS, ATPase and Fis domain